MGKIVLIILLANTGGARNEERRVYFNTLAECVESLKETKIVTPLDASRADDNTWIATATCGYEDSSDYKSLGNKRGN